MSAKRAVVAIGVRQGRNSIIIHAYKRSDRGTRYISDGLRVNRGDKSVAEFRADKLDAIESLMQTAVVEV